MYILTTLYEKILNYCTSFQIINYLSAIQYTFKQSRFLLMPYVYRVIQGVQLKSGPYFNKRNLFTKIYNMLYYTTNLYLQ